MTRDMTPFERLEAAIHLEEPDRVPIVPYMTGEPIACLAGISNAEISLDDRLYTEAALKVFDEYGGWDGWIGGPFTPDQIQSAGIFPLKIRVPGRELPENYMYQIHEEEVMRFDDYGKLLKAGFSRFYYEDYLWRVTSLSREQVNKNIQQLTRNTLHHLNELKKRNVNYLSVTYSLHPFFMLSLMRSLVRFTEDLYTKPETVERVLGTLTDELIPTLIHLTKLSGVNRIQLVEERASTFTYPLRIFERFWWPYTQEIVNRFWAEGIITLFHLDTPWTKNLEYFRKLPRGSFILGLDSTTDIFYAKEILSGHAALYGDVPASLLSIGQPRDIERYTRKLIEEVGEGGGFILGTGCSAPPDLKPENFRAFLDCAKSR